MPTNKRHPGTVLSQNCWKLKRGCLLHPKTLPKTIRINFGKSDQKWGCAKCLLSKEIEPTTRFYNSFRYWFQILLVLLGADKPGVYYVELIADCDIFSSVIFAAIIKQVKKVLIALQHSWVSKLRYALLNPDDKISWCGKNLELIWMKFETKKTSRALFEHTWHFSSYF